MLAVLVGLALGLRATRSMTAPILLGLVVVIGASPLVGILMKRRVPPVLAYIISILVIVFVILALMFLMSYMIFQTRNLLPELQDQLTVLQQDVADTFAGWGIDISGVIKDQVLKPENIVGWAQRSLYTLRRSQEREPHCLHRGLHARGGIGLSRAVLSSPGRGSPGAQEVAGVDPGDAKLPGDHHGPRRDHRRLELCAAWALGVPYPFTWAFLSFVMSYIPNLGFIIALLPPMTLAILERSWGMFIGVVVGYLVINFVADSVFKPRILKKGVDLPVAVSFLSLLIWGFVLGPIGALLAVPMTMMVRTVLLEASPETESLALLLRSGGSARTRRGAWWWFRGGKGGDSTPGV